MPTIDERIVQMRFDNEQFERNVSTSLNTLAKLKQSLQFERLGDSLKNIEIATDSLNDRLSGLESSVQKVTNVFTPLGRIGQKVFDDIADRAVKAGKAVADAFTGFSDMGLGQKKYETQTKAVQTITNATGKSVAEVENVLEDLQHYTDETSYDFSAMVENIGKFTAVGVELERAEKAMEGIANEAALSGANKMEANRAMYNFAQALSSGSVKVIDWKSIENANMGTKEFKEELIKTAIALGTLEDKGDGVGAIMKQTKKATKTTAAEFREVEVDFKSFRDTLSEGWLTSDVLIETLNRYADTTNNLGKKAYAAAREALTWGDAIDAVHDAVSSGWMQTYKLIFGNLDEARVWWTYVAESLVEYTDIFTSYRNEVLKTWHTQGGYQKFIQAAMDVWTTFMDTVYATREALSQVIPAFDADKLLAITDKVSQAAANLREVFKFADRDEEGNLIENRTAAMERFQNIVRGVAAQVEILRNFVGALLDAAGRVVGMFKPLLAPLIRFWSMTSEMWQNLNNQLKETDVYRRLSDSIVNFFGPVGDVVVRVANGINKVIDIYASWLKVLGKENTFSNFYEFLKEYTDKTPFGIIFKAIEGAIGIFGILKKTVGSVVNYILDQTAEFREVLGMIQSVDDALIVLEYYLSQIPIIGNLFKDADGNFEGDKLITIKNNIVEFVTGLFEALSNGDIVGFVADFFKNLWATFSNAVKNSPLGKVVDVITIAGYLVAYAIQSLINVISGLFKKVAGLFGTDENGVNPIAAFFNDIWETLKSIPEQADKIGEKIAEIRDKIKKFVIDAFNSLKELLTGKNKEVSSATGGGKAVSASAVQKKKSIFTIIGETIASAMTSVVELVQPIIGNMMQFAIPVIALLVGNAVGKLINGAGGIIDIIKKKSGIKVDTIGDTVLKIAGGFAMLATIVAVLAMLDPKKVENAFEQMKLLLLDFVMVAGILAIVQKNIGLGDVGKQMLMLTASVGALAVGLFLLIEVLKWGTRKENIGYLAGAAVALVALMGLLGVIEGAIAVLVSRFGKEKVDVKISGIFEMCKGIVAIVIALAGLMVVMKIIKDPWIIWASIETIFGIIALLGGMMVAISYFVTKYPKEAEGKFETKIRGFIPMAIALLAVVFAIGKVAKIIKQYGWEAFGAALATVAVALGGMAYIIYTLNKQQSAEEDGKKSIIRTISIVLAMVGIALAAHIFADAANKVKDVPFENLITFLGAITALVAIIAFVGSSAGTSGAVGIIAVAGALAAGIALIGLGVALLGKFAGIGIEAGTQAIWLMGSRLGQFSDMVADINWDNVKKVVHFVTVDIPAMWAAIMGIDFNLFASKFIQLARSGSAIRSFGSLISSITGNILVSSKNVISLLDDIRSAMDIAKEIVIPDFITNGGLTRLGATIKNYTGLISGIEATKEKSDMAKQVVTDAKDIADSMAQISVTDGIGVTLVNLGSALDLYYRMLNNISTNENGDVQVPTVDSQMISQAFSALAEAVPVDDIATISSYAAGGDNDMTQMAIGINALGEALGSYGEKIGTLDAGQVESANSVLDTLAKVNRDLNPRDIFTWLLGEKDEDSKSLTSFADDITAIGEALGNYGSYIGSIKKTDVENANSVLEELIKVQKVVEGEGVFSKIFKLFKTDESELSKFATDIGLLGENLGAYGSQIGTLDKGNIEKANSVINRILTTYRNLPDSGGFLGVLFDHKDLGGFATNIGDVGSGIKNFADAIKDASFTNSDSALTAVERLVTVFNTLDNSNSIWSIFTGEKSFSGIGSGLKDLGDSLTAFQSSAETVTYSNVESAFSVIAAIIDLYKSLDISQMTYIDGATDKLQGITENVKMLITEIASLKTATDDNGNLFILSFIDVGKMIVNAIKMGFTNQEAIDAAREELKVALGNIRGAADDEEVSFTSVGIAIVNQIAEGIRNEEATNDAVAAIIELMNRIKKEAKDSIVGDVVEEYSDKSTGKRKNAKGSKFGQKEISSTGAKEIGGKRMSKTSSDETKVINDNTDAVENLSKGLKTLSLKGDGKPLSNDVILAKRSDSANAKEIKSAFAEGAKSTNENTKTIEKATSTFDTSKLKYLDGYKGKSADEWMKLYENYQNALSGKIKKHSLNGGEIQPITEADLKRYEKSAALMEDNAELAERYSKFNRDDLKYLDGKYGKSAAQWEKLFDNYIAALEGRVTKHRYGNGKTKDITDKDLKRYRNNLSWMMHYSDELKNYSDFNIRDIKYINGLNKRSAKSWKSLYETWQGIVSGRITTIKGKDGNFRQVTQEDIDRSAKNIIYVEEQVKKAIEAKNKDEKSSTEEVAKAASTVSDSIKDEKKSVKSVAKNDHTTFDTSKLKYLDGYKGKSADEWMKRYENYQNALSGKIKNHSLNGGEMQPITEADLKRYDTTMTTIENAAKLAERYSKFDKDDLKYLDGVKGISTTQWEKLYDGYIAALEGRVTKHRYGNGKTKDITDNDLSRYENNLSWIMHYSDELKNYSKFNRDDLKYLDGVRGKSTAQWEKLFDNYIAALEGRVTKHRIGDGKFEDITDKDLKRYREDLSWMMKTAENNHTDYSGFDIRNIKYINGVNKRSAKTWKQLYKSWQDIVSGRVTEYKDKNGNMKTVTQEDIDRSAKNIIYVEEQVKKAMDIRNQRINDQKIASLIDKTNVGDKGENVKLLQDLLVENGYLKDATTENGVYGKETKEAVENFQKEYGKNADKHENDDYTKNRSKIDNEIDTLTDPIKGLKAGDKGEDVKRLQKLLNASGYLSTPVAENGIYDQDTVAARVEYYFARWDRDFEKNLGNDEEQEEESKNVSEASESKETTPPNTSEWMEGAKTELSQQNDALSTALDNIAGMVSTFTGLDAESIKSAISDGISDMDLQGATADKLSDVVSGIIEDKFGIELPDFVTDTMSGAFGNILELFGGVVNDSGLSATVVEKLTGDGSALQQGATAIGEALTGEGGAIQQVTSAIGEALTGEGGVIQQGATAIGEALTGESGLLQQGMEGFNGKISDLTGNLSGYSDAIQSYADELGLGSLFGGASAAKKGEGKSIEKHSASDKNQDSIKAMNEVVAKAGETVGTYSETAEVALANANMAAEQLRNAIANSSASGPDVRPVVDDATVSSKPQFVLTDVESNSLIKMATSAELVSTIASAIQKDLAKYDENNTSNNNKLLEQFNGLNDHLNAIDRDILNMKIYLDSDAIVAGTVSKMDRALGQRHMTYSGGRR